MHYLRISTKQWESALLRFRCHEHTADLKTQLI